MQRPSFCKQPPLATQLPAILCWPTVQCFAELFLASTPSSTSRRASCCHAATSCTCPACAPGSSRMPPARARCAGPAWTSITPNPSLGSPPASSGSSHRALPQPGSHLTATQPHLPPAATAVLSRAPSLACKPVWQQQLNLLPAAAVDSQPTLSDTAAGLTACWIEHSLHHITLQPTACSCHSCGALASATSRPVDANGMRPSTLPPTSSVFSLNSWPSEAWDLYCTDTCTL